jgi:hypothetical protein
MQVAMFTIGLMTPHAVYRHAKKFSIEPFELRQYLVVESHLITTDGTPIGRIESEDYGPTAKVAERNFLVGTGR